MTDDELTGLLRHLLELNALDPRGSKGRASEQVILDVGLADLDRLVAFL